MEGATTHGPEGEDLAPTATPPLGLLLPCRWIGALGPRLELLDAEGATALRWSDGDTEAVAPAGAESSD